MRESLGFFALLRLPDGCGTYILRTATDSQWTSDKLTWCACGRHPNETGQAGRFLEDYLPHPVSGAAAQRALRHMRQGLATKKQGEGLMAKLLLLVHTVSPSIAMFDSLGDELLPGVKRMHILDEPLLECIRKRGRLAPEDSERMYAHLAIAEKIGADVVLVTCSSVSPCVDDVCSEIAIPVVRIDDAMIEQALSIGTRISVVATSETTLEPTRQRLYAEADRLGRQIQVDLQLAKNALPALIAGDSATHDRLVREAVLEKMERADLIVLAQASMARVLQVIPEAERRVSVLSSPRLAIDRVARVLEQA